MRKIFTACILFLISLLVFSLLLIAPSQAGLKVKASMVTPRTAAASAVVDGKIYVIGGMTRQGRTSSVVEVYDPASEDRWIKASMPTPRCMMSAVAVGKFIYVIGGRNESGITNIVEVYDTEQNSWKKVKSMPTARWNHMVAEVGGKIYVMGGITGVGNRRESITKVEIYDTAKDLWSNGIPMPEAKQGAAVAVNQGKIYILGGRIGAGDYGYATANVEIYNTAQKKWDSAGSIEEARTGAQAAIIDEKIYIIGGTAAGVGINTIEIYDLANGAQGSLLTMQNPRTGHSVAAVGNKIYIIGGMIEESLAGIVGTVEELNVDTKSHDIKDKDSETSKRGKRN